MANTVKVLSTDGRTLRDAPDTASSPVSVLDQLAGVHQQLDAVLPAVRPRQRLGGLAAARGAEREKARARIEGTYAIDNMRAAGKNVKTLTLAHDANVKAARIDAYLSEEGREAKVAQLRQSFTQQLIENSRKYDAAESELLASFPGRSKTWAATRDKSGPVASTYAAATALAGLLPLWTPEDVLERIGQAINERDSVLIDVAHHVLKSLVATDARYETLRGEAETLLEDAVFALGSEETDCADLALERAAEMRAELSGAQHMAITKENWDVAYDQVGLLRAFDAPASDGESSDDAPSAA